MRVRFAPTPRSSPEYECSSSTACDSSCCTEGSRRQRARHSAPAVLQLYSKIIKSKKMKRRRPVVVATLKDLCLDVLVHNVRSHLFLHLLLTLIAYLLHILERSILSSIILLRMVIKRHWPQESCSRQWIISFQNDTFRYNTHECYDLPECCKAYYYWHTLILLINIRSSSTC